jgi:hypothetical protein
MDYRDVRVGGYNYRQYKDGTIEILAAPGNRGVGTSLPPGNSYNRAITGQIGPYKKTSGGPGAYYMGARGAQGPNKSLAGGGIFSDIGQLIGSGAKSAIQKRGGGSDPGFIPQGSPDRTGLYVGLGLGVLALVGAGLYFSRPRN